MTTKRVWHFVYLRYILCIITTLTLPLQTRATPISPPQQQLIENYGKTPLAFEQNQGQTDDRVRFLSRGQGYALFLTQNEAILSLSRSDFSETSVVTLQLIGANPDPIIEGQQTQSGVSNYLIGSDASRWQKNVEHIGKVKYHQVYDGIDLVYYGNQRRLEYDYIVSPGADPKTIRLGFKGAKNAHIDKDGNLILHTTSGKIVQQAPLTYQQIDQKQQIIPSHYIIHKGIEDIEVSFGIEKYDRTRPLIIDPILSYSIVLDGSQHDSGNGISVDPAGNIYIAGSTSSVDFPLQNAFQNTLGTTNSDAFITKFDPTGKLVYSTFLGGSHQDVAWGIATDPSGNVCIKGFTSSADFPTHAAFQYSRKGTDDVFVAKLDPNGALVYSTYLGGNSREDGRGKIAMDASGNAYVTGGTESAFFPTQNAFQSSKGGQWDAFITKLSATGTLVYSSFLGGDDFDTGRGVAVDLSGNVCISGYSRSFDFPTQNAFQSTKGGGPAKGGGHYDAFITKLDPNGSVIYSSYLGGSAIEESESVDVDALGNAYISGTTYSTDFPTQNALQSSLNGYSDAFVSKLDPNGAVIYSTYLSAHYAAWGHDVKVDQLGGIYVRGVIGRRAEEPSASWHK